MNDTVVACGRGLFSILYHCIFISSDEKVVAKMVNASKAEQVIKLYNALISVKIGCLVYILRVRLYYISKTS